MVLGYSPTLDDIGVYYRRMDITREMLRHAQHRDIVMPHKRGFRDRENVVINTPEDISRLAQRGIFLRQGSSVPNLYPSFHGTVRRSNGLCDLVFEVDMKQSYKSTFRSGSLLLRVFDKYDLPYIVKFSGNTSPHIIIPGEAFPEYATGDNFPIVAHAINSYIEEKTKVRTDGSFASGNHFLRLPYSLNENTGLVSIPIDKEEFRTFDPSQAEMNRVEVNKDWWTISISGRGNLEDFISEAIGQSRGIPGIRGLGFMEPLGDEGHRPRRRVFLGRNIGIDRQGEEIGEEISSRMENIGGQIEREANSLQRMMGHLARGMGEIFTDSSQTKDSYRERSDENSKSKKEGRGK